MIPKGGKCRAWASNTKDQLTSPLSVHFWDSSSGCEMVCSPGSGVEGVASQGLQETGTVLSIWEVSVIRGRQVLRSGFVCLCLGHLSKVWQTGTLTREVFHCPGGQKSKIKELTRPVLSRVRDSFDSRPLLVAESSPCSSHYV